MLLPGTKVARNKLSGSMVHFAGSSPSNAKNLCVNIDSDFSFGTVTKILFISFQNITKTKEHTIPSRHRKINALITSRLDYCNVLLSGCSNKDLNKLQLVQNLTTLVHYHQDHTGSQSHLVLIIKFFY